MSIRSTVCALLATAFLSLPATASIVYSTGQDNNADGMDDYFQVDGKAAYLVTAFADGWRALPNSAVTTGKYISWDPIQSGRYSNQLRGNAYAYTYQFNWAGASGATAMDFRWISDDYLTDVTLNGASLGINNLGASQVWRISNEAHVNATVLQGLNSISFMINNNGGGASGLAADFTVAGAATAVANDVPEPSSLWLAMGALALVPMVRRRRG